MKSGMRFFAVTAKCGHVGKNFYYEGTFFEKAENAKEAAATVRMKPRVKHHHTDAILFVTEITRDEYIAGSTEFFENPYFNCTNRQQQQLVWEQILPFLRPETDRQIACRQRGKQRSESLAYDEKSCEGTSNSVKANTKVKKPYKRERFSLYNYDFVAIAE